jgi:lysophospholipase
MRRGLGLVIALGLLAACSPRGDPSPFAESQTPPGLAERFLPPEGWAWGFIQVGDAPAQRYGVAAAIRPVRADILILPDYGETAETWFETIRDLTARDYRVWVLEGAGQGGSGRLGGARDRGDVKSFEPDIEAAQAMIDAVIHPTAEHPIFLLAQGASAVVAIPVMARGAPVKGLVLSSPRLGQRLGGPSPKLPISSWRKDMRDAFASGATHDPWRGAVTLAWQRANPDLRMGAPTSRWTSAFRRAVVDARLAETRVMVPVVILEGDGATGCQTVPRCAAVQFAGGDALELERDAVRDAWLAQIGAFIGG